MRHRLVWAAIFVAATVLLAMIVLFGILRSGGGEDEGTPDEGSSMAASRGTDA